MSVLNLEQQRKLAKDLLRAHRRGDLSAAVRIVRHLPRARNQAPEAVLQPPFTLSEAQLIVAREAGFSSWPKLKHHIDAVAAEGAEIEEKIIDAALAGQANAARGGVESSIYAACAVADADSAMVLLDRDASLANRRGGRRNWTPLLYLCCSRYRRNESETAAARVRIARRLIELGGDVNAAGLELGYTAPHINQMFDEHEWRPIDGAAGRLAESDLVRLLLEAGADLNKTYETVSQAVRAGNVEVLTLILESGPKEWWQIGWALKACAVLEKPDMARILVPHLSRPRVPGTALLEAIRLQRNPELMEVLLGDDDDHPLTISIWRNAYRAAIRYAHREAAALLLRRGADDGAVTDADRVIAACMNGQAPSLRPPFTEEDHRMLAWAIRAGRYYAVPLLLDAGCDPNVADRDGEFPLHLAVRANSTESVEALLNAGARLDTRNFESEAPLDVALALGRTPFVQRLLDAGAIPAHETPTLDREEMNVLFERAADAVVYGELETLRELLDEEPALVHARSPRPHRATLLHYCGANGTEDPRQRTPPNAPAIAKLLLERGAEVNATCNLYGGGSTTLGLVLTSIHPLHAGVRMALVEVLVEAGAWQGLLGAAALGRLDVVRRLVDSEKTQIQPAFMWACQFGRTEIVEFLLENGADAALQDGNGMTGLHLAAVGGHLDTVRLLLRRGSPLELQNVWGGTVLGNTLWAAFNYDPNADYAPIVEALIDAGAHVDPEFLAWWMAGSPLFPASKDRVTELLRRKNP
jgi:ankyrin repeat protein